MDMSEQGAAFVAAHEGFVPRWYLDPVGIPTIGIGFTWRSESFRRWWGLNRPGQPFERGATMTRAEANQAKAMLFREEYGKAVNDWLGGKTIPQHQFDAIGSIVFNCGAGTLNDKWAQAFQRGNVKEAARLMAGTRTTARGKKLPGLERRRAEEAALLLHGDYAGARVTLPRSVETGPLSKGSRGGRVLALQNELKALRLYDGALDGQFGSGTQAAVMEFQRSRGLTVDGVAGPLTLNAMREAVDAFREALKPAPAPQRPAKPETAPAPALGGFWAAVVRVFNMIMKGTWK